MVKGVDGYYDTGWLTGLWSTHTKVDDVVPKSAWNWGGNCIVVNGTLGEPGRTPLCVSLRTRGAPWTVTVFHVFQG